MPYGQSCLLFKVKAVIVLALRLASSTRHSRNLALSSENDHPFQSKQILHHFHCMMIPGHSSKICFLG